MPSRYITENMLVVFCLTLLVIIKRTTHYSLIIQSFAPESTSSARTKNPFEVVMDATCLVKQNEQSFAKKCYAKCYEKPSTRYLWCVLISLFRPSFAVVHKQCVACLRLWHLQRLGEIHSWSIGGGTTHLRSLLFNTFRTHGTNAVPSDELVMDQWYIIYVI